MEIRWYLIVVIVLEFFAFFFAFFGHGNDLENNGDSHGGLWKSCFKSNCQDVTEDSIGDSDTWKKIQATKAMLILSHFAGIGVFVQLVLAMLSVIKASTRVVLHSITCLIQAFFLGLAVFLMTDLEFGVDMGWSQAIAWVAFVFACLVLPAGCTQIDENGKEVEEINAD